jgi:hypothetical protein
MTRRPYRPRVLAAAGLVLALASTSAGVAQQRAAEAPKYRTLDDHFPAPDVTTLEAWKPRAAYLREHILASAGLLPLPAPTPLNAAVFGEVAHNDYTVSKVYFESLPGFFVTGNLYRPAGNGPFPAIISPHGHWAYGRLENTDTASVPGRAINLARQGFVVFTYDMIGYNDSRQLTHTFGGKRENLWGLSLAGLQLWNSIRSIDFLQGLPYVKQDAIGATGASGGATQTFLVSAVDDRIAVTAPVNMISLHMQGGCLCENIPGLRLDANNVELAGVIAPRPLLMVSATGDWTNETMKLEYPAMQKIYGLFGATDHVHGVQFDAPHNYNKNSREAVYAWMARWLQKAPPDVKRPERSFTVDRLPDVLVFHGRSIPSNALTAEALTQAWIDAARHQLASTPQATLASALRHALGFAGEKTGTAPAPTARSPRTVLLASPDPALERELRKNHISFRTVPFTPFDAGAAAKINHFDTYNRTEASQRVADLVAALRQDPAAVLVADGDAALAGLLAMAIVPGRRAVLDVGDFDTSSDAAFVEKLYIPGLRRAGDLQTAASMAGAGIAVHGAGPHFQVRGLSARSARLAAHEIVTVLGR